MPNPPLPLLARKLEALPGVIETHLWAKVPQRERIYVDLKKFNRERCWNLGAGRRVIVHATGFMEWGGTWAGAMTRDWHRENRTWQRIQEAVHEFFGKNFTQPQT